MPQPVGSAIHCINPKCPHPYPHSWGNKFCNSCGAPLQLKNRYVPLQQLGSGGFAKIYTVWDLAVQTEQVLKVLIEPSPKALELFEQEAAVLASLRHPGVPRVDPDGYFQVLLNKTQERPLPCLVMEKINGQTLEEILEQHPQGCPEGWVFSWFRQAVDILQELHSHKVIHRDIKPSNLMLRDSTRQLVVIDLGGAKQISPASSRQASSTKLFSSGYSPPEQIAGRGVGPAADFYALGRTMIQLLTGIYPPELEDRNTGELRWRNAVSVSPDFADLLDDLVQEDVNKRPATARVIQERLAQSQSVAQVSLFKLISSLSQTFLNWVRLVISAFTKSISDITQFLITVIVQIARACRDTIWAMVLSAIATCVTTSIGFILAYWSPLGTTVAAFVAQQLPYLFPNTQITVGSEIMMFTAAGLGTAWGLTAAGGFGQRRRYLVAALMGLLGYGLSWLVWRLAMLYSDGLEPGIGLIGVAVTLLTLGIGLPSHYLVHAVVASAGTSILFAGMVNLNLFSTPVFQIIQQPGWFDLWHYIAFFDFVSIAVSFWLGVSYYLIVPCLRFLGWR
ncbi:MAG: serine/threonine protein kinase [Gloeocapsa sp. UFS-A4-WI-NPMV-4B04]|nr:serine/threonine protein kinase [Gloeocapsa sp. UFS-A4-WI-NPMV-4B04]